MRFGLIARADDRGIGIQTWEVARHLKPERVLVVAMPPGQQRFVPFEPERYAGLTKSLTIVPAERMGDPAAVAPWCSGLDVIYSVETFYDWRFCDIARAEGARTVLHANPEFVPRDWRQMHKPDVWWAPTPWLYEHHNMPVCRIVPMPVPLDRWPQPRERRRGEPVSFLHVVGHQAMADRNGTRALAQAMAKMQAKAAFTFTTQKGRLHRPRVPLNLSLDLVLHNQPDYWRLYDGHDVLVLPRRYGGLCLPALEAAGAGLALVMSRQDNAGRWPAYYVPGRAGPPIETPVGVVPTFDVDSSVLAQWLDRLATDDDLLSEEQQYARAWAENHSWQVLVDDWRYALEDAAA